MPDKPLLPWKLIRKGSPPMGFLTLELAQRFYDRMRFNRAQDSDATVFGPGGKEWRCGRFRAQQWAEVFGERRTPAVEREDVEA